MPRGWIESGPILAGLLLLRAAGVPAPAASLQFLADARSVEDAETMLKPATRFGDFTQGFTRVDGGQFFSLARQASRLRPEWIGVISEVGGELDSGRSLFHVSFAVDEPTPYWLSGNLAVSGNDGFACISLVDMAYHDEPVVNEIAFTPPGEHAGQSLERSGWLAPGNYTLEAMIYAGGEGVPGRGSLDLHFSIPEPGALGSLVGIGLSGMLLRRHRRRVTESRAPGRTAGVPPPEH